MIELSRFGQFCLLGAGLVFVYDRLRVLRRIFRHGIVWVSLEDFTYWLVAGIVFFLLLCRSNDGILRGYLIMGTILGAAGYYAVCSRPLMKLQEKIILSVKKRLKKVWKLATMKLNSFHRRSEKPEESGNENESKEEKTT